MSKKKKELPQEISINAGNIAVSIGELLEKKLPEKRKETSEIKKEEAVLQKKSSKITHWSLQKQTAGRGGKIVTLVVFPKDLAIDLEVVAKQMRRSLGCGSYVEENKIILQGDISERASVWLEKQEKK